MPLTRRSGAQPPCTGSSPCKEQSGRSCVLPCRKLSRVRQNNRLHCPAHRSCVLHCCVAIRIRCKPPHSLSLMARQSHSAGAHRRAEVLCVRHCTTLCDRGAGSRCLPGAAGPPHRGDFSDAQPAPGAAASGASCPATRYTNIFRGLPAPLGLPPPPLCGLHTGAYPADDPLCR